MPRSFFRRAVPGRSFASAVTRDFAGVFDGNGGNDSILGGAGRDLHRRRLGSDLLYGMGGDDRLYGDGGDGITSDVDVACSEARATMI